MYRTTFHNKEKAVKFALLRARSPMLVQLKGIASRELRRGLSGWAVDGCNVCRSQGKPGHQAEGGFWGTRPSPCPPGSQDVWGSAGPGCSADFSLLRMVFGLLPICWLFGLLGPVSGGLHSSGVRGRLWEPHLLRCGAPP